VQNQVERPDSILAFFENSSFSPFPPVAGVFSSQLRHSAQLAMQLSSSLLIEPHFKFS
jgi:hypothetical protein